jgi:hypothetical protein
MKRRGEEGVTLEELLIAMLMTGILLFPLLGAMFNATHSLLGAESRAEQSNGTTLLSSYFGPDVQNAVSVASNTTDPCGGGAVDLLLTAAAGSNPQIVAYYRSVDGRVLLRRTCTGGTASTPIRLMRNVSGVPTFTCAPTPDCVGWSSVSGSVVQLNPAQPGTPPYTTNVQATKRTT